MRRDTQLSISLLECTSNLPCEQRFVSCMAFSVCGVVRTWLVCHATDFITAKSHSKKKPLLARLLELVASRPGERGLNKCLYGETPTRGPTPYPFIYHFSRKRYPFRIRSIDKWYPFHIPFLNFVSLLTAVNALSYK